jgi:hypothetical protein
LKGVYYCLRRRDGGDGWRGHSEQAGHFLLARLEPGMRAKKAVDASEMASHELDRLGDPSATDDERLLRKRRLMKGPKEFRDIRNDARIKR